MVTFASPSLEAMVAGTASEADGESWETKLSASRRDGESYTLSIAQVSLWPSFFLERACLAIECLTNNLYFECHVST